MLIAFLSLVTNYKIVIERVPTTSLLVFDSMLAVIMSFIQAPKKTNAVCVEGTVQLARRLNQRLTRELE